MNIEVLKLQLSKTNYENLRLEVGRHFRKWNIGFDVFVEGEITIIETSQGKNEKQSYFNKKELTELSKKIFFPYLKHESVRIKCSCFAPHTLDVVDVQWVKKMMFEKGLMRRNIVEDTGISDTEIKAVFSGTKAFTAVERAMFYFYFIAKQ